MRHGYQLDNEDRILVDPIVLFEYRKQALTPAQRHTLEESNPHLFGKVISGAYASPPIPDMVQRIPPIVFVEQGLIVERDTEERSNKITEFQRAGIAKKFSLLKSTDDIVSFANEYGLLGCKLIEHTHILESPMDYLKAFSYHHSYFEPLKVWEWHIDHVKKLFQLYRALRYKTKIEGDLLRVEELPIDPLPSGGWIPPYGLVYWNDGKLVEYHLLSFIPGTKEIDYTITARGILVRHITRMLKSAIDLSYDTIEDDETSELGFSLKETRRTRFLLAAIYYDLWQSIKNRMADSECEYCGTSYIPNKRTAMYCSNACKQAAYRKNKNGGKKNG